MGFQVSDLWQAPVLNPVNKKARSIPVFNPVNRHGRVFFFSWLGFMLAFWAWYTFPPLLTVTIKKDLNLTSEEVANSNIISLVATLLVRFVAGPLCDHMGSRKVFSMLILVGSIPIGLAPLVKNASGLYVIRFFIGILGGSFVPCQVWCTGWFDKNVVGTANALAGGWGNAGGGITYFIMPAVYDSLVHSRGRTPGEAWRLTFLVPLVCLIACGLGLLLLCEDTPMGKWDDRHAQVQSNLVSHGLPGEIVNITGTKDLKGSSDSKEDGSSSKSVHGFEHEADISRTEALETAQGEIVVKPSVREGVRVVFSLHGLFHVATYACSFGGELAINAILASYYLKNFPTLGQTNASNYAAIFGFLNFITRPAGGVVSDLLYNRYGRSLWLKKAWIHVCGLLTGALLILIGTLNPHHLPTMVGLIVLLAVFHEAGNGANFALVPHVFPYANGILSGLTGAGGNLGGVIFAIIFRYMGGGTDYAKGFWVIGVIHVALNLAVCWIPPLPKGQIGGH
ncbi:major facilitator superfamily domain-containing protein [Lasiosphaeria miniovina]|uniref:Nitrate/nitrite transporter n=1 Tax=Lasiosphaeria miniovina TaxID=1954250 RepID=A0AA40AJB1_9PEZI|nr:major facilitator superfamily domain-containing protein [Lasiosphaeria miniovina]KAK0716775.1 major facilitator superfamily domain-containing protein [Lasiosphaeria miniovina]